jgi:hypothetical protein
MDCFLWRPGLEISTKRGIGARARDEKGGRGEHANLTSLSQAIAFFANINSVNASVNSEDGIGG